MFGDDLYYYGFQKDQQQLLDEIKESIEVDRLLAKLTQGRTGKVSGGGVLFIKFGYVEKEKLNFKVL